MKDDQPKPSVLIVDDSTPNLRLTTSMLLEQGLDARPMTSGKLAYAVAKASPPDLILLDIDMPGMDGFELCKALKADDVLKDIPIIFISGQWTSFNVVKGLGLGGVDFVPKPFHAEEITARIRTHLRIVSLQRELAEQNQELERQVAERTRSLANANRRLAELTKVKGDFLHMIAHELRTPANGLFGFSELLCGLCPPSEQTDHYRTLYESSKQRLLNLINDATVIADLTQGPTPVGSPVPLLSILDELRRKLPQIAPVTPGEERMAKVLVYEERGLLLRALQTFVLLAEAFSTKKGAVILTLSASRGFVTLQARLDDLRLPADAVPSFFEIESLARSSSAAELLGLSPVVAQRVIYGLGGDLRLSSNGPNTGHLEAILATDLGGYVLERSGERASQAAARSADRTCAD